MKEPSMLVALLTRQHPTVKFCTCQDVSRNVRDCEMHGHMFKDAK